MRRVGISLILLTAILGVPAPASAATGTTTRVSVASDGTQANNGTDGSPANVGGRVTAVSGDGRYVSFVSDASNLVPGDTNNAQDVFLHDRDTGGMERVSIASDGTQANGISALAAISTDGRYVAFSSSASNLVPGDTNFRGDVFLHDRVTGSTERVSVASDGTQAYDNRLGVPAISGDGSGVPAISGDGRYVAFFSRANNLVPGDTNAGGDVFVHDRVTGSTERVSVASDGTQTDVHSESYVPTISGDGRYVAFTSPGNNLVPGDTNGTSDAFVRDRVTGSTERVSVASDGTQADGHSFDPAISGDGRHVAFYSHAGNLAPGDTNGTQDVFVRDRVSGSTERVSVASDGTQANGPSISLPAISADGRYVAFQSFATNLVPGDTNNRLDVFVYDRDTGGMERGNVAGDGTQANDHSLGVPAVSADGRYVAFTSSASNLVPGDTNGVPDVFVRDRQGGAPSDTTPPTLTLPDPITAEATGPAGTTVGYTATAADDTDHNPTVSCAPASGSTFPIGTTTVDCTATDATGNQTAGSFTVTVADTTAPALTLPDTISTDATGPGGAAVSYTATAADTVDPNPAVSCAPPSGSTFPLGTTTVDCTAADATGNQATGNFTVTVVGAAGQLEDLEALITSYPLKATVESSLLNKLTGAQDAIAAGKTGAACSKLADFLGQVADFQAAGKLTAAQATQLTADGTRIRAALGC